MAENSFTSYLVVGSNPVAVTYTGNLFRKNLQILDLKSFRSQVKGKHYTGGEFQSLAV